MNFSDLYEGPSCCSAVVTGLRVKSTEKKEEKKKTMVWRFNPRALSRDDKSARFTFSSSTLILISATHLWTFEDRVVPKTLNLSALFLNLIHVGTFTLNQNTLSSWVPIAQYSLILAGLRGIFNKCEFLCLLVLKHADDSSELLLPREQRRWS